MKYTLKELRAKHNMTQEMAAEKSLEFQRRRTMLGNKILDA